MAEAIFGLIGVVVGALISGGAAFLLARRAEQRRARAAARLLEAELRFMTAELNPLMVQLNIDRNFLMRRPKALEHRAASALPGPRLWSEHKATLAEVFDRDEWFAVARAYEAVAALRHFDWDAVTTDEGHFKDTTYENVLRDFYRDVEIGMTALATAAGSPSGRLDRGSRLRARLVGPPELE